MKDLNNLIEMRNALMKDLNLSLKEFYFRTGASIYTISILINL